MFSMKIRLGKKLCKGKIMKKIMQSFKRVWLCDLETLREGGGSEN